MMKAVARWTTAPPQRLCWLCLLCSLSLPEVHGFLTKNARSWWSTAQRPGATTPVATDTVAAPHATSQSCRASTHLSAAVRVPSRHVRWQSLPQNDTTWALQTAVTTWVHPSQPAQQVEVHAMVHIGDAAYYDHYNQPEFNHNRVVLYELLVDQDLLQAVPSAKKNPTYRQVTQPLQASVAEVQLAQQYQWACQSNVLQYHGHANWWHADLTTQEFQAALAAQQNQKPSKNNLRQRLFPNQQQPLWQQATATTSNWASSEVATAVWVGPPTLTVNGVLNPPQLFPTLPSGGFFLQAVRALLWGTVPVPELSILVLDWARLATTTRNAAAATWSPTLGFVLRAVAAARWDVLQRLAFGQVLVTSAGREPNNNDVLIQGRNVQALKVLEQAMQDESSRTIALLYGCSHGPDLSQALRQRGFVPQSVVWRTAWSVRLGSESPSTNLTPPNQTPQGTQTATMATAYLLPILVYIMVSGIDWWATWEAVLWDSGRSDDLLFMAVAYLVRHVVLYMGISKLVLDWQTSQRRTSS